MKEYLVFVDYLFSETANIMLDMKIFIKLGTRQLNSELTILSLLHPLPNIESWKWVKS